MRLLQEYAQLQRASASKRAPRGGSPGGASDDEAPPTAPDPAANPAAGATAPMGRPTDGRGGAAGSGGTVWRTEGAAGAQPLRTVRLALVELRERVPLAQAALLVAPLLDDGASQIMASEMGKVCSLGCPICYSILAAQHGCCCACDAPSAWFVCLFPVLSTTLARRGALPATCARNTIISPLSLVLCCSATLRDLHGKACNEHAQASSIRRSWRVGAQASWSHPLRLLPRVRAPAAPRRPPGRRARRPCSGLGPRCARCCWPALWSA